MLFPVNSPPRYLACDAGISGCFEMQDGWRIMQLLQQALNHKPAVAYPSRHWTPDKRCLNDGIASEATAKL